MTKQLTTAAIAKPLVAFALLAALALEVSAHPMPNTVIDVSADARGTRLTIAVPVTELRLALPPSVAKDADLGAASSRQAMRAYFDAHLAILSTSGVKQPHLIESVEVTQSTDPDVGQYQELSLQAWVPAAGTFNPRAFTLQYDAVIHQVPNHSAVVRIANGKVIAGTSLITFDFSRNGTRPVDITLDGQPSAVGSPALWTLAGVLIVGAVCAIRLRRGPGPTSAA